MTLRRTATTAAALTALAIGGHPSDALAPPVPKLRPAERQQGKRKRPRRQRRAVRHGHWWPHRQRQSMMTATASEYGRGDGSTGGPFACGGTYEPGTVAVANKTLPCWTRVVICFRRCAVIPVRDRGPFVAGRDFDMTDGAADAVGAPWPAVLTVRWRLAR